MSRLRFVTARALFETFPEVGKKTGVEPTEQSPIAFAAGLIEQGKAAEAATVCAYLLPRREAVWWACGSVRELLGDIPQSRAGPLLAAEAWVYKPDDERRQAALEIGTRGDANDPLTWCALGAGWAGGFLIHNPKKQVPMPQYMTARAVRIAVIVSSLSVPRDRRSERVAGCVTEGLKLAETGL